MSRAQLDAEISRLGRKREQLKKKTQQVSLPSVRKHKARSKQGLRRSTHNQRMGQSPFMPPRSRRSISPITTPNSRTKPKAKEAEALSPSHSELSIDVEFRELSLDGAVRERREPVLVPDFEEGKAAQAEADALELQVQNCMSDVTDKLRVLLHQRLPVDEEQERELEDDEQVLDLLASLTKNPLPVMMRQSQSAPASLAELANLQQQSERIQQQMHQNAVGGIDQAGQDELQELLLAASDVQRTVHDDEHSEILVDDEELALRAEKKEQRRLRKKARKHARMQRREQLRQKKIATKHFKVLYHRFYNKHIVAPQRMRHMEEKEKIELMKMEQDKKDARQNALVFKHRMKHGAAAHHVEGVDHMAGTGAYAELVRKKAEKAARKAQEEKEEAERKAEELARVARAVRRKKALKRKQQRYQVEKQHMVQALEEMEVKKHTILPKLQKVKSGDGNYNPLAGATIGLKLGKKPTKNEPPSFKAIVMLVPQGNSSDPAAQKVAYTKLQKWAVMVLYRFARRVQKLYIRRPHRTRSIHHVCSVTLRAFKALKLRGCKNPSMDRAVLEDVEITLETLARPSFKMLHTIIRKVMADTGFGDGLFESDNGDSPQLDIAFFETVKRATDVTYAAMTEARKEDHRRKVAFFASMARYIGICRGVPVLATTKQLAAGPKSKQHDGVAVNHFLQVLFDACANLELDLHEAVRRALQGEEPGSRPPPLYTNPFAPA